MDPGSGDELYAAVSYVVLSDLDDDKKGLNHRAKDKGHYYSGRLNLKVGYHLILSLLKDLVNMLILALAGIARTGHMVLCSSGSHLRGRLDEGRTILGSLG
jgi:hypothetical protein